MLALSSDLLLNSMLTCIHFFSAMVAISTIGEGCLEVGVVNEIRCIERYCRVGYGKEGVHVLNMYFFFSCPFGFYRGFEFGSVG